MLIILRRQSIGITSAAGALATVSLDTFPGDWDCNIENCSAHNFAKCFSCFMCGTKKDLNHPLDSPGDWYCNIENCSAHNFAKCFSCFMCGTKKDLNHPLDSPMIICQNVRICSSETSSKFEDRFCSKTCRTPDYCISFHFKNFPDTWQPKDPKDLWN